MRKRSLSPAAPARAKVYPPFTTEGYMQDQAVAIYCICDEVSKSFRIQDDQQLSPYDCWPSVDQMPNDNTQPVKSFVYSVKDTALKRHLAALSVECLAI